MSVAFHTVFILNENIKWLEEFIVYYINLGIEQFYLYDNEGSEGYGSSTIKNKYGFEINTSSNENDRNMFNNILQKYGKYITYIVWQPRDQNNRITYGQNEAIYDCIAKYGHLHEWICLLDLDEFIFSEKNINLVNYLQSLDTNISAVTLIQKKFLDRFLTNERYITQEFGCIDGLKIGTEWAPKNIIRCRDFVNVCNIHYIGTRNTTIVADVDIFRFNHYNVNDVGLAWMKSFYNRTEPFEINGTDDGMLRYRHLFNS